jgi:hypothetical protein
VGEDDHVLLSRLAQLVAEAEGELLVGQEGHVHEHRAARDLSRGEVEPAPDLVLSQSYPSGSKCLNRGPAPSRHVLVVDEERRGLGLVEVRGNGDPMNCGGTFAPAVKVTL